MRWTVEFASETAESEVLARELIGARAKANLSQVQVAHRMGTFHDGRAIRVWRETLRNDQRAVGGDKARRYYVSSAS
ncbi:MAG TPA: hypothetical protein VL026_09325, partial [Rhizomicrobium sp.]|nr:hypothetical protein [Rhizomicrobium sp.]